MRIAVVATSYPSSSNDPAGHFVRAEAHALLREGHEVHVVAPSPYAGDAGIVAHAGGGIRLFQWPGAAERWRQDPSRLIDGASFGLRAARVLRAIAPERVVAHWMMPSAVPIALAARHAELEVVCHGADVRLLVHLPALLRDAVVRSVVARASLVTFVATSLRDALLASLPVATARALARMAVVRPPRVDVASRSRPVDAVAPYAVCASRLVADKRTELGVHAVLLTRPAMSLLVIGDGPRREMLERAAHGRVRFLGKLGRDETLGWVSGAAALLHTSAVDAAPTTVLEARALGVPVVSCGAGDVARWAVTDPGIALATPDAPALARALDRVRRDAR